MTRWSVRLLLGIAASVVAVLLLAQSIDLETVAGTLSEVDSRWLAIPLVVVALQLGLRAARWDLLIASAAGWRLPVRPVAAALAVGYLGNAILPARLGEVARVLFVARRNNLRITPVAASVVLERAVDLTALATIATVAAAFVAGSSPMIGVVVPAMAVATLAGRRLVPRLDPNDENGVLAKPRRAAAGFLTALVAVPFPTIAAAYGLSVVAWFGDAVLFWCCASSLSIPVTLPMAMAIGIGAALGTILPSAGGYVGTYELGVVAAGALSSISGAALLSLALLAHVMAVVPLALVGVLVIARVGLGWRVGPTAHIPVIDAEPDRVTVG